MAVIMNATLDEFMVGLEEAVVRLPEIFLGWHELEDGFGSEYASQFEWMLAARKEAAELAAAEGRSLEIAQRLARVSASLLSMSVELQLFMNISVEQIVEGAISGSLMFADAGEEPYALVA